MSQPISVDLSPGVVAVPLLPDGKTPLSAPAVRSVGAIVGGQLMLDSYAGLTRDGITDDSGAYATALDDAMRMKCALHHGPGPICLKGGTALPTLDSAALEGEGVDCQDQPYGTRGTSFWIYDQARTAFPLAGNVRLRGLNFYWPAQQETGKPPVAYPPLFGCASATQGFSSCTFEDLRITNAYDIWVADQPGQIIGDIQVRGVRACALNDVFRIAGNAEVVDITDCLFSYESFDDVVNQYGVAAPSFGLRDYVTATGSVFHVRNTPAGQTAFFKVSNTYIFGFGRPLYVEATGALWFHLDGVDFDGCQQVLQLDPGGSLDTCFHRSGLVFAYRPGHSGVVAPPVWNIDKPAHLSLRIGRDVVLQGSANSALVSIAGASWAQADINLSADEFTAPVAVLVSGDNGGVYRFDDMRLIPAQAGSYVGVQFTGSAPQLGRVCNNYFHAPSASFEADAGGPYHVAGNSSLYTSGTHDVALSGNAAIAPGAWNCWAKP